MHYNSPFSYPTRWNGTDTFYKILTDVFDASKKILYRSRTPLVDKSPVKTNVVGEGLVEVWHDTMRRRINSTVDLVNVIELFGFRFPPKRLKTRNNDDTFAGTSIRSGPLLRNNIIISKRGTVDS